MIFKENETKKNKTQRDKQNRKKNVEEKTVQLLLKEVWFFLVRRLENLIHVALF